MRRSTAKVTKLAGALGLVLALPLSFAATPADKYQAERNAAATSFAQFASAESVIDAWRNYALADLSTGFSWASAQSIAAAAPSLFDRGNARLSAPASRFDGSQVAPQSVQVTYAKMRVSDSPLAYQDAHVQAWRMGVLCAFNRDGACLIYGVRPSNCRTAHALDQQRHFVRH